MRDEDDEPWGLPDWPPRRSRLGILAAGFLLAMGFMVVITIAVIVVVSPR